MGDRESNRPVGVHLDTPPGMDYTSRSVAGVTPGSLSLLEEERWMLSQGVLHGELRDEIYCQTVKQLSANPNPYVHISYQAYPMSSLMNKLIATPARANLEVGNCSVCF
jgi:hypothetical protein